MASEPPDAGGKLVRVERSQESTRPAPLELNATTMGAVTTSYSGGTRP